MANDPVADELRRRLGRHSGAYRGKPASAERAMQRLCARVRLRDFCIAMKDDYEPAPHQDVLIEHLEAVERGDIRRLMVFEPPRHSKSMHVSQLFPCWYLGKNPDAQIVNAGYAQPIALEQSRRARDFFASDEFRCIFPEVRHEPGRESQAPVAVERQAAQEWGTNRGGRYYAVGVGGGLTGRGFDLGIIDDPIKDRKDADSKTIRDNVGDWYQSTFYTRQSPNAAIILCMTRWHPDDLAGRLLDKKQKGDGDSWTVLDMPAIDSEGRPLWAARWPLDKLNAIRRAIGAREWNALYMQRPTIAGGAIFKQAWWEGQNRFDATGRELVNSCVSRVISWDTAEKPGEDNAYSAYCVGELTPAYQAVLREVGRDRYEFPTLCQKIEAIARRYRDDGKLDAVLVEDKSSGTQVLQMLRTTGADWLRGILHGITPKGDKIQRGYGATIWCELGAVWFPMPSEAVPWLFDFEQELFEFPSTTFKDQTDSFTQLIWYWHHCLAAGLGMTVHD